MDKLDWMNGRSFVWQPYSEGILHDYAITLQEKALWHAVIPLILFEVVEWHQPDRVMQ